MKLSRTFVKTFRESGKEETARGASLLMRAGYINKEMAGVYDYLPLGMRVLENIKNVIREELNAIGGEEVLMTTLQNPEPWEKSGRWESEKMDIWFKTELSAGGMLGLAPTHEEPITNMLKKYVSSYKDLPIYVYQFQNKFRNELRAKSGILRAREFLMNDMYSFTTDQATHEEFYHKAEQAYERIYERLGLGDDTYECFASGGVFSKYSHEYQTLLPIGEDTVYHNADKSVVLNEEVLNDEVLADLGAKREDLTATAGVEVGNIFSLKYKYSEPLGLVYNDADGERKTVFMGCYGIGVSRVMGVIVEKYADDKGLVWPETVAPYQYYVIGIGEEGEKIAAELHDLNPEAVILDDREMRPGQKFADAELMGIPRRVVISEKTLGEGGSAVGFAEVTLRADGESKLVDIEELKREIRDNKV